MTRERQEIRDDGWEQAVRARIGTLARLPIVADQLTSNEGKWLVKPWGTDLDLAFVAARGGEHDFVAVDICGIEKCVGIQIAQNVQEKKLRVERLTENSILTNLLSQGAEIGVLTVEELKSWVGFYNQVDRQNLISELGKKAYSLSGLRVATERDVYECVTGFDAIIEENWGLLNSMGVASVSNDNGFDFAFLNEDGQSIAIPLYHVRSGFLERDSEILEEVVSPEPLRCLGVVVRWQGETKRQVYERAERLRVTLEDNGAEDVIVPVLSSGQLSLWRKLGFIETRRSILSQSNLSPEELVRFLYLGKSNRYPGELARKGLSLPGSGKEFGMDIIFYQKDSRGERALARVDNVLGYDFGRKGEPRLRVFNDVVGLIIIPESWTREQIREYEKEALAQYDYHYRSGKQPAEVVYVTWELLDLWLGRGSIFAETDSSDVVPTNSNANETASFYGMGTQQSEKSLHIWRTQSEIGGAKIAVSERRNEEVDLRLLDFGISFTAEVKGLRGLTSRTPTSFGLVRDFNTGRLPMIPGIYDTEYLMQSARNYPGLLDGRNRSYVASFIRAELRKRVDESVLCDVLGRARAQKILKLAEKDIQRWYPGDVEIVLDGVFPTHGHVDHVGEVGVLRRDAGVVATTETCAHIVAMSVSAKSWRERLNAISLITQEKIGSAYQTVEREILPIHFSGEQVRIGNMIIVRELVNHSITGSAMTGVSMNGEGGVLYTGDLRMGRLTDLAVERMAGKYETIVIETTNFDSRHKASAGVTEEMVKTTIAKLTAENQGNPIVVALPNNHMERLASVYEVAEAMGRKLAVSTKHAEMVRQLRAAKLAAPDGVDGFDYYLPEVGEEVGLWMKPMTQMHKYQRVLTEIASGGNLGIVDQERLSKEKGEWMIVISPFELLQHNFGGCYFGGKRLVSMFSSYFQYEQDAKYLVGANLSWLNQMNGKYYIDSDIRGQGGAVMSKVLYGLHASGHATFKEMMDHVLIPLLGDRWSGKRVVLVHGENPVVYSRAMEDYLGLKKHNSGLTIISKLKRYNPEEPLEGAFKLRLE